jgi:hypothetical protein
MFSVQTDTSQLDGSVTHEAAYVPTRKTGFEPPVDTLGSTFCWDELEVHQSLIADPA